MTSRSGASPADRVLPGRPADGAPPSDGWLTIGRLAAYVGVTVRTIRHYHQRGLLAEPQRDASGYRRYGAQAVIDLIRIRTLSEAGVPLAQIQHLLDADPERLAASVTRIEQALNRQIEELQRRRSRVCELVGGDRLYLPAELADYLAELRDLGISDRAVRLERDGWILLVAHYPDRAPGWLASKRKDLTDLTYQRLYQGYDQAWGWQPDDPRLAELAEAMVGYLEQHHAEGDLTDFHGLDDPTVVALLGTHFGTASSPGLTRLYELIEARSDRPGDS
jgi:DNA-binding transcriptional MerR regulator